MKKTFNILIIAILIIGLCIIPVLAAENNPVGVTIPELSADDTMEENLGTIEINNGTITKNSANAIINTNNGTIINNEGTIENNNGIVDNNSRIIINNFGKVKNGTITNNFGTVDGGAHIENNYGGTLLGNVVVDNNFFKVTVVGNIEISGNWIVEKNGNYYVKEGETSIGLNPKGNYYLEGEPIIEGNFEKVEKIELGNPGAYLYEVTGITGELTITAQTEELKTYTITEGNNQTWSGSGDLRIVSDGDYDKYINIDIMPLDKTNEEPKQPVENDDFTIEKGSTIVTIKERYLKTLSKGNYQVNLLYTSGMVSANFEIKELGQVGGNTSTGGVGQGPTVSETAPNQQPQNQPQSQPQTEEVQKKNTNNPPTGDNIGLFIGLAIISIIGIVVVIKKINRK